MITFSINSVIVNSDFATVDPISYHLAMIESWLDSVETIAPSLVQELADRLRKAEHKLLDLGSHVAPEEVVAAA
jgi:hypothetical protein